MNPAAADVSRSVLGMSRNSEVRGRSSTSKYASEQIAAMSLDQLRQLSDLQLSDRELADVIQAIHTGGADSTEGHTASKAHLASDKQQCVICQQVQQVDPEQCLACQGGGTIQQVEDQIQHFTTWVRWYQDCYQPWAAVHSQHVGPPAVADELQNFTKATV